MPGYNTKIVNALALRFALLYGFWLCMSGMAAPLFLALGALSVLLVMWLSRRMGVAAKWPGEGRIRLLRLPGYLLWLIVEVVTSAWFVARAIVTGHPAPRPQVLLDKPAGVSSLVRVVYANSITLTPGTLTVQADAEGVRVHALADKTAADLRQGTMRARVAALSGEQ